MKKEGREEKWQFSLHVSIILRLIVQKTLNDPKAAFPKSLGWFGEHLALFFKRKDLAVKAQLTLGTGTQIHGLKGIAGLKGILLFQEVETARAGPG